MKICSKCKKNLELSCFNKDSSRKDGLSYICRDCSSERGKTYYKKNTVKISESHKTYYHGNTEKVLRNQKQYLKENEEIVRLSRQAAGRRYNKNIRIDGQRHKERGMLKTTHSG